MARGPARPVPAPPEIAASSPSPVAAAGLNSQDLLHSVGSELTRWLGWGRSSLQGTGQSGGWAPGPVGLRQPSQGRQRAGRAERTRGPQVPALTGLTARTCSPRQVPPSSEPPAPLSHLTNLQARLASPGSSRGLHRTACPAPANSSGAGNSQRGITRKSLSRPEGALSAQAHARAWAGARVPMFSSFVFGATFAFLVLFSFWEQVLAKLWLQEASPIINSRRRVL